LPEIRWKEGTVCAVTAPSGAKARPIPVLPDAGCAVTLSDMNPSMCRAVSTFCFLAGLTSIILSIGIWWLLDRDTPEAAAHAERFGIFVGLWAPTLLILSNRFDRYADKARLLPGLDPKLDAVTDENV
jgi:hypothetical protein